MKWYIILTSWTAYFDYYPSSNDPCNSWMYIEWSYWFFLSFQKLLVCHERNAFDSWSQYSCNAQQCVGRAQGHNFSIPVASSQFLPPTSITYEYQRQWKGRALSSFISKSLPSFIINFLYVYIFVMKVMQPFEGNWKVKHLKISSLMRP